MAPEIVSLGTIDVPEDIRVAGRSLEGAGWAHDARKVGDLWDLFLKERSAGPPRTGPPPVDYGFYFIKPGQRDWDYCVGSEAAGPGGPYADGPCPTVPAGPYVDIAFRAASMDELIGGIVPMSYAARQWAADRRLRIRQPPMPPYPDIEVYPRGETSGDPPVMRLWLPLRRPGEAGDTCAPPADDWPPPGGMDGAGLAHGIRQEEPVPGCLVSFGPHRWRVLEERDGLTLVVCDHTVECRGYHDAPGPVTWAECELRRYLNHSFLDRFDGAERSRIVSTRRTGRPNPWYGTDGGERTDDRVFLLDVGEVVEYFGDSGDLARRRGWHWDETGHKYVMIDGYGQMLIDRYNSARIAREPDGGPPSWWWTRSPGSARLYAVPIGPDGTLGALTGWPVQASLGIRPALWLAPWGTGGRT